MKLKINFTSMDAFLNSPISSIFEILLTKGHEQYGTEAVSQLEHALQCATLAETSIVVLINFRTVLIIGSGD